ncbi:NAD(P)/FAD-dependent oxidoreductase [Prosthecobacter debontii]|nr:FAD-dependent oxidoreductase [Prosthecobacter debontii]
MSKPRLCIIGTGISGLGCAYLLDKKFDITLYEAADYVGGHTNTVTVCEDGEEVPIDTGFMVFNHQTYPLLCRLFRELGVETKRTDMSFSLRHDSTGYEYNGKNLDTLFGQRRNLVSPRFWRFLLQIQRFNEETVQAMNDPRFEQMSLREYTEARGYGQDFLNLYILPMGSAVWSTPPELMMDFPARTLMHFWFNHGFLGMKNRHPWWTVVDGSRQYVRRLIPPFKDRIRLRTAVQRIERREGKVTVHAEGQLPETYDKVILATHAPTSLKMLDEPTPLEEELLPVFKYQSNIATLHTDDRFMPRTRKCWASWNYHIRFKPNGVIQPSTHYWMNLLQGVSQKNNYFVSINAPDEVAEEKVIRRISYEHPLFDLKAVNAQKRLPELNRLSKNQTTYYCGAWFRYGFHEDGFMSAVNLCRDLLGEEPW